MDCYDSPYCCGNCEECEYMDDFLGPTIDENGEQFEFELGQVLKMKESYDDQRRT